jgi:hypothetical protein
MPCFWSLCFGFWPECVDFRERVSVSLGKRNSTEPLELAFGVGRVTVRQAVFDDLHHFLVVTYLFWGSSYLEHLGEGSRFSLFTRFKGKSPSFYKARPV